MSDLTSVKTLVSALTYEQKIELSSWLHKEIQAGMADNTKKAAEKLEAQTNSFLDKAAKKFKLGSFFSGEKSE
jgi:hypothetical protein